LFAITSSVSHKSLHSFPTRRSSDLKTGGRGEQQMFWYIDPSHTQVNFSVKHMMVSTVRGRLGRVAGRLQLDPEKLTCVWDGSMRSEEHTSELQSRVDLVCRLLLEKK